MADAAGTTVLDASFPFESELILEWAKSRQSEVSLVHVDREDDPAVFREIDKDNDGAVTELAREMSAFIRVGASGHLRVEARRFDPASLPAVLKAVRPQGGIKSTIDH